MDKEIVRMAMYENLAMIAAMVIIWLFTGSAWSLLILLYMNSISIKR